MMMKTLTTFLAAFAIAPTLFAAPAPITGIVGAMDVEIEALLPKITDHRVVTIANHQFHQGQLADQNVIVTKSGVGKVNAALTTTLLIQHFGVDQLIFTGIAGASDPRVDPLDVVISTKLVQHDVDLTAFDRPKGLLPEQADRFFFADEKLQTRAYDAAVTVLGQDQVFKGIIASGDQFIADKQVVNQIHQEFSAMAVEMEGAALGQVAQAFDVPYVVIRTISDKADGSAELIYEDLKKATAHNAANITFQMLSAR